MSRYDELKKGHKVSISTDVNTLIRGQVFASGWDVTEEDIEEIIDKVFSRNYFLSSLEEVMTSEEKEEMKDVMRDKANMFLYSFKHQEPTMRQIYYYCSLCSQVEEDFYPIYKNEEMVLKIRELLEKIKEQDIEREQSK